MEISEDPILFGAVKAAVDWLAKFVALEYEAQKVPPDWDSLPGKAVAFPDGVQYLFGRGAKERMKQLFPDGVHYLFYGQGVKERMNQLFPDGGQYMFCGQGAKERMKLLLLELLESLRFGTGFALAHEFTAAAGVQLDEHLSAQRSYQMRLKTCLVEQKVFIVLDGVWDMEVLEKILVLAGVTYLITSQNKEIWRDVEQIHLKRPILTEVQEIMANHIACFPIYGEFDDDFKVCFLLFPNSCSKISGLEL